MSDETDTLRAKVKAAQNLLAVLHRDGGRHTAKVGFIQSCKDGEKVRHLLLAQVEELKRKRDDWTTTLWGLR